MELFVLLIVLLLLAAMILPWVNMGRISRQRNELQRLKDDLEGLEDRWNREPRDRAQAVDAQAKIEEAKAEGATQESCVPGDAALARGTKSVPVAKESVAPPPIPAKPVEAKASSVVETAQVSGESDAQVEPEKAKPSAPNRVSLDESASSQAEPKDSQDWFSKVAVWVGSIALLMAGFYMIKYSIDEGWMTPAVRIWLTTGFGALLCGAGFVISLKSVHAANERIGQALSGAGVACLYFAAYAAVHMYGFLSAGQGFVAMIAVTVLAVVLSLKNGAPVAMMGLVGGFLTPWLMSTGSNDTVMLFSYLFVLFCGAQFLCIRRGWWALLLGSLVGAYLWSAVVIIGNFNGLINNLEGTLIFVLGICLVNAVWVFLAKPDSLNESTRQLLLSIRWVTWGGGLIQGLILVLIGGFAAVDMALFSILSVGALLLAVVREDEFVWASWLALAAVFAGTLSNSETALWSWLLLPLGLAGLFFAVGHWRGLRSERSVMWRGLSVVSAVFVVPLLYLNRDWIHTSSVGLESTNWLWMSAGWAVLIAIAGEHLFRRDDNAQVAGEYSTFASVLLSFGLWTSLPSEYHTHAAGILLILSALYWRWREFGRAALIVSIFSAAWAALMALYAADAVSYFFSEEMSHLPEQDGLAVLAWALGIAGGAAVVGCYRRKWGGPEMQIVVWLLGLVGLLGVIASYQWLDVSHMPEDWTSATVEGGLTSLLALAAVAFAFAISKWRGCQPASLILSALVGLRVVYLHLSGTGAEGESFFLNALLLQFGIPFIAAWILAAKHAQLGLETPRRTYQIAGMALGFVWATFLIQDYFGGSRLFDSGNSSTEIYTYSVVWLLLAVLYQAIGLIRNQAAIHVGSLILLLITVGKVFLVDASELEGLFRVLSFLGLGLALIGIGYFYNKVVFARRKGDSD